MKTYLIFFLNTIIPFVLYGQIPNVEFTTYTPRWVHIVQDTNFKEGTNENINSFSTLFPVFNPVVDEESGYVSFACNNGDSEHDGIILVKVKTNDGQILWERFMNTSNGDDQNFYTSFYVDDKIYYSGRKRTKKSIELGETWQLGGHSKAFYRIIDKYTGIVNSEVFDDQDSIGVFAGFIFKILLPLNKKMKQIERMNQSVMISNLEENSINISSGQILRYPPQISPGLVFKTRALFIRENDKRCNVYFHSVSKDTTQHQHVGRLDYYSVGDDSLQLQRSVDFSKYIKKVPVSGLRDRFYRKFAENGSMVMTQTYEVDEYPNYRCWLLKLNDQGEVTSHIENIKITNQNHTYELVIPFYVDDYNVLLMGYPSVTVESGLDVIQVNNSGEVILRGHLTTGSQFKMGIGDIEMNNNGDIIFSFQWEQQYSGMMGMHISDFGINLSTENNNSNIPAPLMTLSPNPVSDRLLVETIDEKYRSGIVGIYDQNGKLLLQQKVTHSEFIDVSPLTNGLYILHFNPDVRKDYFLTGKFIKLD